MKKVLLVLVVAMLFMGCADAVPYDVLVEDEPYGFWSGLWHGICVPVSFVGSLIWEDIAIYAVNNNGGWYDFGFFIGVGGLGFYFGNSSS
jgi:hypothetical protein